jgi:hypothetical protein
MSYVISANRSAWAFRNRRGRYAPRQKFWPVFITVPVIAAFVMIGHAFPSESVIETSSLEKIADVQVLPSPCNGVCDLTDPATKAKWQAWEKSPMKILSDVCASKGLSKDAKCPTVLAAMARQESVFGKVMTGDGGTSKGWFHISSIWHDVPKSCSYDLKCSASWTLDRMIGKGYVKNWEFAVMSHNGTPGIKATRAYLASVKKWMRVFVPTLFKA